MTSKWGADTTGSELVKEFAAEIKGKAILVTGVTPGGLGAIFAETIAKAQPSTIVLAGRNKDKIKATTDAIQSANPDVKVKVLELDLGSFSAVRRAAETINSWDDVPHIDVLVNNAGIMAVDFGLTEDGFERQFGTNHLGPFLFTNLIMGKIRASDMPRIIVVSSDGHRLGVIRWTDYNYGDGEFYNRYSAYGQSKTANNLFALALAEKLGPKGLQAYSLHPGVILSTGLGTHLDWSGPATEGLRAQEIVMGTRFIRTGLAVTKTPEQGIATHVYTSFAPDISEHNGSYFNDCRLADPFKEEVWSWGASKVDAQRLWQLSEQLVGQEFKY